MPIGLAQIADKSLLAFSEHQPRLTEQTQYERAKFAD